MAPIVLAQRPIRPVVPRAADAFDRLNENLQKMGLSFLLSLPWDVTRASLVEGMFWKKGRSSEIRGNSRVWTQAVFSHTYKTPEQGSTLLDGKTIYKSHVESKFRPGSWLTGRGWGVDDCLDCVDLQPVLAFLIPILNPEKQGRITLGLATTIVVSMEQTETINWSGILEKLVKRQIANLKSRMEEGSCPYTYVTPYVSHIYWSNDCFSATEKRHLLCMFPSVVESDNAAGPEVERGTAPLGDSELVKVVCAALSCKPEDLLSEVLRMRKRLAFLEESKSEEKQSTTQAEPNVAREADDEDNFDQVMHDYEANIEVKSTVKPTEQDDEQASNGMDVDPVKVNIEEENDRDEEFVPEGNGEEEAEVQAQQDPEFAFSCPRRSDNVDQDNEPDLTVAGPSGSSPYTIVEPLTSAEPQIQKRHDWSLQEWAYNFQQLVLKDALKKTVVISPKHGPVKPCPTYDDNFNIPIDENRDDLTAVEIFNWVYFCRRVYAPFISPNPIHRWPHFYYAWVGPDGVIIMKSKDDAIIEARQKLKGLMILKSKNSKGSKMISWIRTLPKLVVLPPFQDAGFGTC